MAATRVRGKSETQRLIFFLRSNGSPGNSAPYPQPGILAFELVRASTLARAHHTQEGATPTAMRMRTPSRPQSHCLLPVLTYWPRHVAHARPERHGFRGLQTRAPGGICKTLPAADGIHFLTASDGGSHVLRGNVVQSKSLLRVPDMQRGSRRTGAAETPGSSGLAEYAGAGSPAENLGCSGAETRLRASGRQRMRSGCLGGRGCRRSPPVSPAATLPASSWLLGPRSPHA